MRKLFISTTALFCLNILASCGKNEKEVKIEVKNDSVNSIKPILKEPRKFTLSELKSFTYLDSLSFRNELKKIGFIPVDKKSNLVFVDSLYIDKVKDEKIGYGYYMLLKSPVITYDEDLKQISLSFPTNQLSYYMQLVNERVKKSHKIETSNIFYEFKNIYVPEISFTPYDYSRYSSYSFKTYEDYSNLFIFVNTL